MMKTFLQKILQLGLLTVLSFGCSKDPVLSGTISSRIVVGAPTVSAITQTTFSCVIQTSGGFGTDITDIGLCWSEVPGPTINDNNISGRAASGIASLSPSGLTPGTTYYVRAYCTTKNDIIYGSQKTFRTLNYQLATISTTSVSNVAKTTAVSGGNITAAGGGSINAKGVCWGTTVSPTIQGNKTIDGTGSGTFLSNISGLSPGTLYYIRAYATNEAGTAYGPQFSFRTASPSIATVSGTTISAISQSSALATATISTSDNSPVIVKGICWSTYSSPTTANNTATAGSGVGYFAAEISGLSSNTLYYIRAYAINEAGTTYGTQSSFRTASSGLATLGSVSISNISTNTAYATASVAGSSITSRGLCWSTSSGPTIQNGSYFSNGSGTASISGSLTGLLSGSYYYVRAYAINSYGTSYGPTTLFQTR